jgi:hypothetical protein
MTAGFALSYLLPTPTEIPEPTEVRRLEAAVVTLSHSLNRQDFERCLEEKCS